MNTTHSTDHSNKPLRILLSGFGLMGKQHTNCIRENAHCELVGIVTPNSDYNRNEVERIGVHKYHTIHNALDHIEVDAVIISSPNQFHFKQAMDCIKRNIPILVEKPLTTNILDARKLVNIAHTHNVPVLVGHHRNHSPLLTAAKSFLDSSNFGQFVAVQGMALFHKPKSYYDSGTWRTMPGGGPILINLIHEIGILRYLCGEITSVSVIASDKIRKFLVEDTATINFRFANGALGNIILSDVAASNKSWEMTSGENPDYPYHKFEACYHYAGTRGSLDFPNMVARYYSDDVEPSWWNGFSNITIPYNRRNPLVEQLNHFIDVVKGNKKPLVSVLDGYKNMLVLDAILKSANNCSMIDIDIASEQI